ncbi:MAG: endonuclease [Gemmatimonadetes bacterium]|nr:endonuclease [Gemmatimonadota bacterium]
MTLRSAVVVAAMAALVLGCRTGLNYDEATGPFGQGRMGPRGRCQVQGDSLRIVSFNVEFGLRVRRAADVLATHPDLRCADVVLLQEMDEVGTLRIAAELGVEYVYYPSVHHHRYGRDFGNAVLSRWPIVEHAKIILPHVSLFTRTRRIAAAATLHVAGRPLRVYSTHLGSLLEVGGDAREAQLDAVVEDAADHRHAIIGGDLNSGSVGVRARDAGFDWPTEAGPATVRGRRWDHIFLRGFVGTSRSGAVVDADDVSDHRPVWVVVPWPCTPDAGVDQASKGSMGYCP